MILPLKSLREKTGEWKTGQFFFIPEKGRRNLLALVDKDAAMIGIRRATHGLIYRKYSSFPVLAAIILHLSPNTLTFNNFNAI